MSLYQHGPSKPRVRRARDLGWLIPGWHVEWFSAHGHPRRTWWPTHRDAIQYATSSEVK